MEKNVLPNEDVAKDVGIHDDNTAIFSYLKVKDVFYIDGKRKDLQINGMQNIFQAVEESKANVKLENTDEGY